MALPQNGAVVINRKSKNHYHLSAIKPNATEIIRNAREPKSLSHEQVAAAIGINKPWYYDLETHLSEIECNLSLLKVSKLLKTLGIDIGSIINDVDEGKNVANIVELNNVCQEFLKSGNLSPEKFEDIVGFTIFEKDGKLNDLRGWNLDCLLSFCNRLRLNVKSVLALAF